MTTVWPATLPQSPSVDGYQEQFVDTTIHSQMDVGPPKIRRRTTAGVKKFSLTFDMTGAQVIILEEWFLDELAGGAVPFVFPDPRSGSPVTMRMVGSPKVQSQGIEFKVGFDAEQLP